MQDLANVFTETNVSVRTVLDAAGEVWFSCTDVAKAVGYSDTQNAVSTLMPERKELAEIQTPDSSRGFDFQALFGKNWKATKVINLEMLNDFLMDSGKPAAKAFRKWVTGTVLPSIEKTGSYSVKQLTEEEVAVMYLESVRAKNAAIARANELAIEVAERATRLAEGTHMTMKQLRDAFPWMPFVIGVN